MEGEKRERWMRLCVEVADEQDSNRLLELMHRRYPRRFWPFRALDYEQRVPKRGCSVSRILACVSGVGLGPR
jgi:hypothetical protein